jgi:hypothetical protein
MRIHFKHYRILTYKKKYNVSVIRDKGIWLIKANTPKHLFGIGITFDTLEK